MHLRREAVCVCVSVGIIKFCPWARLAEQKHPRTTLHTHRLALSDPTRWCGPAYYRGRQNTLRVLRV